MAHNFPLESFLGTIVRFAPAVLPLNAAALRRVAVIGPLADSARDTVGPWVFDHDLTETVTILDGIRGYLGDRAAVSYEPGITAPARTFPSMFGMWEDGGQAAPAGFDPAAAVDRAVRCAADADVAIVVLGEGQDMIGEGASRSDLSLPGEQRELLAAVAATGTPVVLVLMNGHPRLGDRREHVRRVGRRRRGRDAARPVHRHRGLTVQPRARIRDISRHMNAVRSRAAGRPHGNARLRISSYCRPNLPWNTRHIP